MLHRVTLAKRINTLYRGVEMRQTKTGLKQCRECAADIHEAARKCSNCSAYQLRVLGPILNLGQPTLTLLVALLAVVQSGVIVWTATKGPAPDDLRVIMVGPQADGDVKAVAFMVANAGGRAAVLASADLSIPDHLAGEPRLQPGSLEIGGARVINPGEVVLVKASGLVPGPASEVKDSEPYRLRVHWIRANGQRLSRDLGFMGSVAD